MTEGEERERQRLIQKKRIERGIECDIALSRV